jgi:hypothetical protein
MYMLGRKEEKRALRDFRPGTPGFVNGMVATPSLVPQWDDKSSLIERSAAIMNVKTIGIDFGKKRFPDPWG